jgi:hypothetical protein
LLKFFDSFAGKSLWQFWVLFVLLFLLSSLIVKSYQILIFLNQHSDYLSYQMKFNAININIRLILCSYTNNIDNE